MFASCNYCQIQIHRFQALVDHEPPAYPSRLLLSTAVTNPSAPPSEEGLPGEVRPRCPSGASLAADPAKLSQRGDPTEGRAAKRGTLLWVLSCRATRKYLACRRRYPDGYRGESRRGGCSSNTDWMCLEKDKHKRHWVPTSARTTAKR